jgi:hypothetical protein
LAERQRKEDAEAKEAAIRQQIQNVLGHASAAVFQSGRITWKRAKDRVAPDVERLSQDHPTLLAQYSKSIAGSRRFVIQTERKAS